ncbi:MAG: gamma-glutamylcyclotransferase [Betaproteobacteria bacterium]|nr:gamma-glutamylcyclotransferase [Betaproteobacteria bacterium]
MTWHNPFLFVYGSLMSGLFLHSELQGAPCLGVACVQGALYDLGDYPGLVHSSNAKDLVFGQVYSLQPAQWQRLDLVEEFDPQQPERSMYLRQGLKLLGVGVDRPVTADAQAYVYNRSVAHCQRIGHGEYRRYLQEKI